MKISKSLVITVFAILVIAVVALLVINFSGFSLSGNDDETDETITITFLEKNKEIALVTLGISDIIDESHSKKLFGKNIPWSKKQTFIKASFEAKLGIDGKDVVVKQTGDKEYEISIPKFIFIGYANPKFENVTNNNGILSFVTEDIDQAELITKMLDEKGQEKYVQQYAALLKESTEEFYKNLLPSIDKDIQLSFIYAE